MNIQVDTIKISLSKDEAIDLKKQIERLFNLYHQADGYAGGSFTEEQLMLEYPALATMLQRLREFDPSDVSTFNW